MTMRVSIPSNLRAHCEQQSSVPVAGDTVAEVLEDLTTRFPELRSKLLSEERGLHSFINVFVNGRNIRDLQGLATGLSENDTLLIVPALAGG